jgi:hypothetical protein
MEGLLALSRAIDRVNEFIGKWVSWLILASILVSSINAVVRKTFNMSSNAWLELQWYLFGAAFLLAAAYTLKQNEHIRIDIVYGLWSRRVQHWIDLIGAQRRDVDQRQRAHHLACQGAASGRFRPADVPGDIGDHQEDRRHARPDGRSQPLHIRT